MNHSIWLDVTEMVKSWPFFDKKGRKLRHIIRCEWLASSFYCHTMSVVQPTNFNIANITISEAKKLDNGSSQAYVNYNGKKLRIQAPKMPIPMDAGDYQGNQKYKVQLSFRDKDSNPKVAAYYKALEQFDNFMIDHAQEKSGPWFKKPGMARDIVVDKFTPSIKYAKDKEGNLKPYPPTHGVALKKNNKTGTFDAELYDKDKNLIEGLTPVDILKRGCEITPILECTGIWITDKGFGATWKLFQARIDVGAEGYEPGCAIQDDEDGEAEAAPAPKPVTKKALATPVASNTIQSDDEDDVLAQVKPAAKPVVKAAEAVVAPPPTPAETEVEDDEVVEAKPVPKPAVKKPLVKKIVPK